MDNAEDTGIKVIRNFVFHPFIQQHTTSLRDDILAFLVSHSISLEDIIVIHQANALGFSFLPNQYPQLNPEKEKNKAKKIADDLINHVDAYLDGKDRKSLWVLLDMSWLNNDDTPMDTQVKLLHQLQAHEHRCSLNYIFHFNLTSVDPVIVQKSFALYPAHYWHGELLKNVFYMNDGHPKTIETISTWIADISNQFIDFQQMNNENIYFHAAFENFPHPVVEADYSGIIEEIDQLKTAFPKKWRSMLETDLQYTMLLISKIRVMHANQSAFVWMNAENETQFLSAFPSQPTHLLLSAFQDHLLQLADGIFPCTLKLDMLSLTGKDITIFLDVVPLEKNDYSRMLLISQRSSTSMMRGLLERSLYKISQLVNTQRDLQSLYHGIHEVLNQFVNAKNFYIALYHAEDESIEFIYHVDELDYFPNTVPIREGKTEYVIRTGETLWVNEGSDTENISKGKYKPIGPPTSHWLGVPLITNEKTIGAIVIRTYDGTPLTGNDKSVMEFCSSQIALAIERKAAEDEIRAFKASADSANIGMMMIDKHKRIRYINPYLGSKLEYTNDEVHNKLVSIFFTNKSENLYKMIDEVLIETKELRDIKTSMMSKTGKEIPFLINAVIVDMNNEQDFVISFSCFNMTNQKKREEALNRYANRLEILHKIDEAILESATIDDIIRTALHVVQQLVKYDHASIIEIQDKNCANIYEGILRSGRFTEHILANQPCTAIMTKSFMEQEICILKDSDEIDLAYHNMALSHQNELQTCIIIPLIAKHENIGQFVVGFTEKDALSSELSEIIKEVSKMISIGIYQTRLYERVETMATIDELTGIYNRRQLIELGEHSLAQVKRSERPFSVIIFDIDYFKDVNDTYGHTTGDKILKKMVSCCKKMVRKMDIFGRYGGDEFVVILPETGIEQAEMVAKRLNTNVFNNQELLEECPIQLSISIGIALLEDKEQTLTQLINHADEAMYNAKKSGRNRIVLYKNSPF